LLAEHRIYHFYRITHLLQPMTDLVFRINAPVTTDQVIEVFRSSGINRPTDDPARISQMLRHGNLTVTAWHGEQLVGIARSLTDYSFCCYLSDLAVSGDYQHRGIGKKLIQLTKEQVGEAATLLLLAAPAAKDYYPKVGMDRYVDTFVMKRTV
jgi:ribosomal protein S18 acetylase RimI-like enzyme